MKKNISLKIKGMHCVSCELLLKEELGEINGISNIKIDYKTGFGSVFLEEEVNENMILSAIEKAGYKGEIINTNKLQEVQHGEKIDRTVRLGESIRITLDIKIDRQNPEQIQIRDPIEIVKSVVQETQIK